MTFGFEVTEAAAARLQFLLKKKAPGSYLRIRVEGGGCSGLQYCLSFDSAPPAPDDHLIPAAEGAGVAVDAESAEFLNGSSLHYSAAVGDAAFKVVNPNAKAGCGCGSSFSL